MPTSLWGLINIFARAQTNKIHQHNLVSQTLFFLFWRENINRCLHHRRYKATSTLAKENIAVQVPEIQHNHTSVKRWMKQRQHCNMTTANNDTQECLPPSTRFTEDLLYTQLITRTVNIRIYTTNFRWQRHKMEVLLRKPLVSVSLYGPRASGVGGCLTIPIWDSI